MSLSIIHLTDIHMVAESNSNSILSRKGQICQACKSIIGPKDNVVITISGDIAFSGKKEEYENAKILIDCIQKCLSQHIQHPVPVLMVPGNHDCDFSNSNSVRNRLLSTINGSEIIDAELISAVTSVQNNFFDFVGSYTKYSASLLCNKYESTFNNKKILFLLFNSAWMSQIIEQPGKIIFPQNILGNFNPDQYDCVFAVMHHPYNWFNPDYCENLLRCFRQNVDVIILGHEHRKDEIKSVSNEWSIMELHGKELQSSNDVCSDFSVYQFDDELQNIALFEFSWNENLYKRLPEIHAMFTRNTLLSSSVLVPSKQYIDEYIDDPGMIIIHEKCDNVRLPELYCWPNLRKIDIQRNSGTSVITKIENHIPLQLLEKPISIIIGDSLVGKTSFAKMVFKDYIKRNECCVLINGEKLNTVNEENLLEKIQDSFSVEYSKENLEKFRQLDSANRIIIVDDFGNCPYHDERRSKIVSYLSQYAKHVIIITSNETEAQFICAQIHKVIKCEMNFYQICNLGNIKRHELIEKWYSLRNEYARGDESINKKIENASEKIDVLLGTYNGIIPATPICIINFLQNLDSAIPASFSGSQYGFLYDSLINKSLSTIKYKNVGALNIDINALSFLAFDMLKTNANIFTEEELDRATESFAKKKKVSVNPAKILETMINARLIKKLNEDTYKFSYPYIFYYFSGRYIAYNLKEVDVKKQVLFMSQRLYNEKYGNIIIFICHFADNIEIIEDILLVAYMSLEDSEKFDFTKHSEIFEKAKEIIDKLILTKSVGTEEDVENNRQDKLRLKDEVGIQDGTVNESDSIIDKSEEEKKDKKEENLQELSAAIRTLDVLGQIIKNYPGDIDGNVKISIIDEIHDLGMRITETLMSTIGFLEEDFISFVIDSIQDEEDTKKPHEIVEKVKVMFSWLIANMTFEMLRRISFSLYNESLLPAVEEAFSKCTSISKKLVLQELQFNYLKRPNLREAYQLDDELKESNKTWFASTVLRSIVANYLEYNKCGYNVRAQLCSRFSLSDKKVLIEAIARTNDE